MQQTALTTAYKAGGNVGSSGAAHRERTAASQMEVVPECLDVVVGAPSQSLPTVYGTNSGGKPNAHEMQHGVRCTAPPAWCSSVHVSLHILCSQLRSTPRTDVALYNAIVHTFYNLYDGLIKLYLFI